MRYSDAALTPKAPLGPADSPRPLSPLEHEYPHQVHRGLTGAEAVGLQTEMSSASMRREAGVGPPPAPETPIEKSRSMLDRSIPQSSMAEEKDQVSGQVPSQKRKRIKLQKGIKVPVYGELTWGQLWKMTKVWLKDPLNVALAFWFLLSGIVFVVLAALELGILDKAVPDEDTREQWIEVTTQILNALFVLMTIVFHPAFIRHTFQLFRWSESDVKELRRAYCRGGHRKPHEWIHMLNLLILLHLTCLSMYAFASIYWVYPKDKRPQSAVVITLVASFVMPVLAFLYAIASPLQRDYNEVPLADLSDKDLQTEFLERKLVFALDGREVEHPEWQGGLVTGCLDKKRTALLSCFLPFVVFGLTAQRLGFGHRWIQACVFLLVVVGPMLVFELAAHTAKGFATKNGVFTIGVALAWFGLTYGAVWRIHMRKAFKLPASRWCCGSGRLTDCCFWLLCPFCALCQEARTAQYYQIVELSPEGDLYVVPEDLEAGGADLDGTDLEGDHALASMSSDPVTVAPDPMIMHDHMEGTPGRGGFVRLEKF